VLVREAFLQDAYLDTSETILPEQPSTVEIATDDGPGPARLDAAFRDSTLVPAAELGLALAHSSDGLVPAGRWIPLLNHPDMHTSVVRPDLLDAEILKSARNRAPSRRMVAASARRGPRCVASRSGRHRRHLSAGGHRHGAPSGSAQSALTSS
jgi:hypothetical protein